LKLNEIESRIEKIEARNKQVTAEKSWETSRTRVLSVIVLTYVVLVLSMQILSLPNPFVSALVPTIGYYLSTVSVGVIKRRFFDKLEK